MPLPVQPWATASAPSRVGDLDEELGDQRPGERRRQRVGALVERVRLEVRPDEVRGEPLAGVDDVGLGGAGAHRPPLDALAERAAADVDGQGDDLDAELLAEPGDGDRRVEPARVGEDDLVHDSASEGAMACASIARNRSSQRSSRASSANRTRSVLSPARVPSCSVSDESSIAWAIVDAVPGEPMSEQDQPAPADRHRDVGEDPAELVVGPRRADGEVLRRDVDVAVAARDLDQAELGDVARDGRLGHDVAAPAELRRRARPGCRSASGR